MVTDELPNQKLVALTTQWFPGVAYKQTEETITGASLWYRD